MSRFLNMDVFLILGQHSAPEQRSLGLQLVQYGVRSVHNNNKLAPYE